MKQAALTIALAAAACLTGHASAHHSTAEFDYAKLYVIRGVVKEFQWTNPHAWVRVLVPSTAGEMQEWGFELGAPVINVRMGWTDKSVAAGDQVTVLFCPSRVPARGTLLQIIMPDGRILDGVAKSIYKGGDYSNPSKLPPPPELIGSK